MSAAWCDGEHFTPKDYTGNPIFERSATDFGIEKIIADISVSSAVIYVFQGYRSQ
jgi:hypothetical protein